MTEPSLAATPIRSVEFTRIIATAGHVDHGKSTLVLALTGSDPDRWAEEKARGLTIDLGFAHTTLSSGTVLSFVDVPGHIRFLKNMLAGIGGVDACLFVVAATEGWKPQSEEHLRILGLLGIRHGVVALTKSDVVEPEWRELAELDMIDHLAGSFLEHAEIVSVDAISGRGLDALRAALDRLATAAPSRADASRPRLWVDRVFSARGSGTIVTGTLTGGALTVDDALNVVGPAAAGIGVRVRSLQTHGERIERARPGSRVAVNVTGIDHHQTARGDALVHPNDWHACIRFDASLQVLGSLAHPVTRRGAYAAYIGSGEHAVNVRILQAPSIEPGGSGFVRVHLPCALPLAPGDRFVLRDHGRGETVGGGEVLDVAPVRPASKAHPTHSIERLVAERGSVPLAELQRLSGGEAWSGAVLAGHSAIDQALLDGERLRIRALITEAGPPGFEAAVLDDRGRAVLELLAEEPGGDIAMRGGRAIFVAAADPLADHPFVAALVASPFSPPDPDGVDPVELRELVRRGVVVKRDDLYFASVAVTDAARVVADLLRTHTEGVTMSQVREALGTSRKYALPLMAELDATGITRRRGDVRIAGPRLP